MFALPHAQTHAVVLPHVLALNGPAAPSAVDRIDAALGGFSLPELLDSWGAPRALRELGMPESGIPAAVAAILPVVPASNPARVTEESMTRLLRAAWEGER
jgi:alcohol dehydrogenase class IV